MRIGVRRNLKHDPHGINYSLLRNYFYFCSYKAQENIKNIIFIMVLRGV